MKKTSNMFNRFSIGLTVFTLVSGFIALMRYAQPFAIQTSRLRQLDSVLVPVLTLLCAGIIITVLAVAFIKKTKGDYAPFGLVMWGLSLMLYSIITPDRVLKVLYAPAIQKFANNSGLHVDVTTIQSVKMITDALNIIACSATVVLGAAVIISMIRRLTQLNISNLSLNIVIPGFLGVIYGYSGLGITANTRGLSFLFGAVAVLSVCSGIIAMFISRYSRVATIKTA